MAYGQPLHQNGKNHHAVGQAQHGIAPRPGGKRKGQGYRDATPKSAPGQYGRRAPGQAHIFPGNGHRQPHRQGPGRQRDDNGCQTAPQQRARDVNQQHLHTEQHKQHGVKNFIDQLPEHVHVTHGGVRHRFFARPVACHQPDDHHGQRPRHMQMAGQGVTAQHGSQGEQDLNLVLVNAFEQPVGDVSQHPTKDDTATRLPNQQRNTFASRRHHAAGCNAQKQ